LSKDHPVETSATDRPRRMTDSVGGLVVAAARPPGLVRRSRPSPFRAAVEALKLPAPVGKTRRAETPSSEREEVVGFLAAFANAFHRSLSSGVVRSPLKAF
jgi:hypothetical protein